MVGSSVVRAILFDFDYTLADSSLGVIDCVGYAAQEMGLSLPVPEQIKMTIGLSLPDTFSFLWPNVSLRQACVKRNFPAVNPDRQVVDGLFAQVSLIIPWQPLFGMVAKRYRMLFERRQVIERIDVVQAAGMDEAHVEIPDVGTVLGLEEQ